MVNTKNRMYQHQLTMVQASELLDDTTPIERGGTIENYSTNTYLIKAERLQGLPVASAHFFTASKSRMHHFNRHLSLTVYIC